jgi:predicted SAM-dependent methyltransferase
MKINLGSGARPLAGFVNVDALPDAPGVDVVARIDSGLPFDDGVADLIYAAHILEHFPHGEVPAILAEWRRVLRPGGQLLVAVPDLDVIAGLLVSRRGWFTPPNAPWVGLIYGGQKDEYDFHKTGFTAPYLAHLLQKAGFGTVRKVDRFLDVDAGDTTWSPLPFGVNISLNMRAVAGSGDLIDIRPEPAQRLLGGFDALIAKSSGAVAWARARMGNRRRRSIERQLRS